MEYIKDHNIFLFLIQILVLLVFSKSLGELFRKWNQPALTAEILVGIFLGPTILGRFFPIIHDSIFPNIPVQQNMLSTLTWLGVFLFLLEVGLETDFISIWRQKANAIVIALCQLAVPMIIVFFVSMFLPSEYLVDPEKRLIFAIYLATTMAICAMPVAARALKDAGILKTELGNLIMSAVSITDILGWLIFSLILTFFSSGNVQATKAVTILTVTAIFTGFCFSIGRKLVDKILFDIKAKKSPEPATSLTFICLLGLICGSITQWIGIHALFGFYIAGIMVGGSHRFTRKSRIILSQFVHALLLPLFFASIGLKIDFVKNFNLFIVAFICIIGMGGRFLGAWLGAVAARQPAKDRFIISITHIAGGTMEIVVGLLAFEYGLIKETVFVAIVFGAVISSILMSYFLNRITLK